MLIEHDIVLNSQTSSWRFKINFEKLKIEKSKKFVKILKKQNQIFALICVDVTLTRDKEFVTLEIFKKIEHLKKTFDDIKIDILLEQNRKNHAIELVKSKKSSFMSLYNLS